MLFFVVAAPGEKVINGSLFQRLGETNIERVGIEDRTAASVVGQHFHRFSRRIEFAPRITFEHAAMIDGDLVAGRWKASCQSACIKRVDDNSISRCCAGHCLQSLGGIRVSPVGEEPVRDEEDEFAPRQLAGRANQGVKAVECVYSDAGGLIENLPRAIPHMKHRGLKLFESRSLRVLHPLSYEVVENAA